MQKSHHVHHEVAVVCENEKILSEKATYDPFIHHRQHICTGVKKKKKCTVYLPTTTLETSGCQQKNEK